MSKRQEVLQLLKQPHTYPPTIREIGEQWGCTAVRQHILIYKY